MIKISSNIYQKQFSKPREKFRFNSTRTFNGSDTLNWRSPKNYLEASTSFFPNINFFRSTPSPTLRPSVSTPPTVSSSLSNIQYSAPPPSTRSSAPHPPSPTLATLPPARSSTTPPPSETSTRLPTTPSYFPSEFSTSLESPDLVRRLPVNQMLATSTPINPFRCSRRSIIYPNTPNLLNPTVILPASPSLVPNPSLPTSVALDLSSETSEYIDEAGIEAFMKVMKALYEQNHF